MVSLLGRLLCPPATEKDETIEPPHAGLQKLDEGLAQHQHVRVPSGKSHTEVQPPGKMVAPVADCSRALSVSVVKKLCALSNMFFDVVLGQFTNEH